MKSFQNFFNEYEYFITPSDIIEFLYCKRFTYFMKSLGISQYEEKRYKVQKGRTLHENREKHNKGYLRKNIGSVKKDSNVELVAPSLGIKGRVDEVHTLDDGTMVPLDYKYAEYDEKVYITYKTQIILYGLMIEEIYGKIVNRGYLVYCRNGNRLVEVKIGEDSKEEARKVIDEYHKVLMGFYPKATRYKSRCIDCCYRNICIR